MHNLLFSGAHTLYMNYVTKAFLLVSSSVSSKHPPFCAGSRPKKRTNITKNFVEFHNHSPLETMSHTRWFRLKLDEILRCDHSKGASEQYFQVLLFTLRKFLSSSFMFDCLYFSTLKTKI